MHRYCSNFKRDPCGCKNLYRLYEHRIIIMDPGYSLQKLLQHAGMSRVVSSQLKETYISSSCRDVELPLHEYKLLEQEIFLVTTTLYLVICRPLKHLDRKGLHPHSDCSRALLFLCGSSPRAWIQYQCIPHCQGRWNHCLSHRRH